MLNLITKRNIVSVVQVSLMAVLFVTSVDRWNATALGVVRIGIALFLCYDDTFHHRLSAVALGLVVHAETGICDFWDTSTFYSPLLLHLRALWSRAH